MTDERVRALERRWRETGAAEDEAAWLAERARLGELARDALELAALAGHAAARLVLGARAIDTPRDDEAWVAAIAERSEPAVVRIARAAVGHVLDVHAAAGREVPAPEHTTEVMALVDDWLACPCGAHESASFELMALGREPPELAWISNPLLYVVRSDAERRALVASVLALARQRIAEVRGGPADDVRLVAGRALAAHALRPPREPDRAGARALLRRVSAGTLSPVRLRVAALLGDPDALDALGLTRPLRSWWIHMAVAEGGPDAEVVAKRAARELSPHGRVNTSLNELMSKAVERVGFEPAVEHVSRRVREWALEG